MQNARVQHVRERCRKRQENELKWARVMKGWEGRGTRSGGELGAEGWGEERLL